MHCIREGMGMRKGKPCSTPRFTPQTTRSSSDVNVIIMHLYFLFALLLSTAPATRANSKVISVHGSGTTIPSKCYWVIMDQLMDRIKVPTRLTYRGVGSTVGIKEFEGKDPYTKPYNDFASGDIPIPSTEYDMLTAAKVKVLHLPVVASAVSIFHSIPGVGAGGLQLNSCLLARIFLRKIVYWDDEEIINANPGLKGTFPTANYPILVGHRVLGASSTYALTKYLSASCPTEWPSNLVGTTITWPPETKDCEGSAGMTACIKNFPGTIGYVESGHGHAASLVELEVQNKDGFYLDSLKAINYGGILSALTTLPTSADQDFGKVDLLNRPGQYTWPIVLLSYIYVRLDLSFMSDLDERGLLIAFLKALYDPLYITQCQTLYSLIPAPSVVSTLGKAGISLLMNATEYTKWTFETTTQPYDGQGDYVISSNRRTYADLQRSDLIVQTTSLTAAVATLSSATPASENQDNIIRTKAALGLSILSILLWFILIGGLVINYVFCGHKGNKEYNNGLM